MPTPLVKQNFPVFQAPVVEKNLVVTNAWRNFFQGVWLATRNLGIGSGWAVPTGAGSRATFNMNATFPVSNPPTQAEVQAIAAQVVVLQKRVGQLELDLIDAGVIT